MNRLLPLVSIAVLLGLTATGCREPERLLTPVSPSPSPAVDQRFALEFSGEVQERLDRTLGPRAVRIGPAGVRQIAPYGQVVMMKIVDSNLHGRRTVDAIIVASAEAAGVFADEMQRLADADALIGVQGPPGGRMFLAPADLLARARNELGAAQLRQRAVFEPAT